MSALFTFHLNKFLMHLLKVMKFMTI